MKLNKIVPLAVSLAMFLSSCGSTNNAAVPAETITSVQESAVITTEREKVTAAVSETVVPDTTITFLSEEISEPITTTYRTTAISETSVTSESTAAEEEVPDICSELPVHSAAAVYCVDDDTFLYNDNINEHIAPASLTKLLTASVALEHLDADMVCTVGSEQSLVEYGSSICYVFPGNKLILTDLLTGMLMASGNDAAYAVAVNTARALEPDSQMSDKEAVQYFCGLMNEFAGQIGMTDSHFVNPDGWDDEDEYTTVSDLIMLTKYALSLPEIRTIVCEHQKQVIYYSGEVSIWTNSNKLLDPESPYYCENAIGVKTGTTDSAGNCLIAAFEKNNKTYISVVTGCSSNEERYELTSELMMQYINTV